MRFYLSTLAGHRRGVLILLAWSILEGVPAFFGGRHDRREHRGLAYPQRALHEVRGARAGDRALERLCQDLQLTVTLVHARRGASPPMR